MLRALSSLSPPQRPLSLRPRRLSPSLFDHSELNFPPIRFRMIFDHDDILFPS